jgi:hypothetical protein
MNNYADDATDYNIHDDHDNDNNNNEAKQKKLLVSGHRPTLILPPDPTKFFRFFQKKKKNASTGKRSSYPSTMTVTDFFHDIHLPVDKTSIVTASCVWTGCVKEKISK